MLKATLREYKGSQELSKRSLDFDRTSGSITIGRSESCDYTIGQALGEWAKGIARVQATLEISDGAITLIDGSRERPSTNGIWLHGEPIKDAIALIPGLDLTLFKSGQAKVSLIVADTESTSDRSLDTYTGQDLLSLVQEQAEAGSRAIAALQEQVAALAEQLTHREAIDTNQERRLVQTEKRLNRALASVLGVIAAIVLASGWSGGTLEDRKQWSSTLQAIAIGIAAAYFKSKENEQAKAAKS